MQEEGLSTMITFRTYAEVSADRQVVLTLPPEIPPGKAEFTVTVAPHQDGAPTGELRRHFGTVRSGNRRAADNVGIDADLAQAYGNSND
jgi:hypothetical protein